VQPWVQSMIEVNDALALVLAATRPKPAVPMAACCALGLVLAEEVRSETDVPLYDKAAMDGYAVRFADVGGGGAELCVLEEITAGAVPSQPVVPGTTTRVMTGAPLPDGADTIVPHEVTELTADGRVRIGDDRVRSGQHVQRRGAWLRRGDEVFSAGRVLSPVDIGLLAEIGRPTIAVHPRPRVAVLATGNELVPAERAPGAGQIRNSNGPMLCALVADAGAEAVDLGIGRDEADELSRLVRQGLAEDVVLISGGVSAGVLDLVPPVLRGLGVAEVFHKVRLKPGKPVWFGIWRETARQTLVFGLPGNPVSTGVCFELFVRPALARLLGHSDVAPPHVAARLVREYSHRGDRPTYFPARLRSERGVTVVELLDWHGSADLRTLAAADGLAYFPAGRERFAAGESVTVFVRRT
jgi:molybdopterin molybdotransferase